MTADHQGGANRLANETSPYLLQHATNPVDWYPWGEEAFARARAEDRPILLSVGYSSCHWCHVMAHESFEDEATAALMNRWFVNIKVDREERPDVDAVYMSAVQALTGQGGWPMTVFLSPDLQPFYAGTYFPPTDGHGRPGFPRLLEALAGAWANDRENVLTSAAKITAHLQEMAGRDLGGDVDLSPELPAMAIQQLAQAFDVSWGGFGGAPKFPSPGTLEFLLAFAARVGTSEELGGSALSMALHTLDAMASGGIYDQLGGGFARYSVDEAWVVPHFEKMLYDNAQLARTYLHAFQWTGNKEYERVARETLDYLARDMRDPAGGFYAAEDADSEGIEGKFYVWTLGEVERLLGRDAAFAAACLGITGAGNFRDPHHPEFGSRNVLTRRFDPATVAARFELDEADILARLGAVRARLLVSREERRRPGLDDKVLASWNGLALAAFAEAGRVLGETRYRDIARANAAFLREQMWRNERLLHTWKAGKAAVDGMLDDYAYVGLGLVELFKATGEIEHLDWAQVLANAIGERFHDSERGGFFDTPHDGEQLLVRPKEYFDQATPSGNSAAALLLAWLGRYYGVQEYEEAAAETIGSASDAVVRAVSGFGTAWQLIEFLMSPRTEIVVVGPPGEREPFERLLGGFYLPWVAVAPTSDGVGLPMFAGRASAGRAVAYFCRDMVCDLPAETPEELRRQLVGSS